MNQYFKAEFFRGNRERLAQSLPDSLIIIPANGLLQKSADEAYEFRQDSSFWYFTGLNEPELILVMDTKRGSDYLLMPTRDDHRDLWEGEVTLQELQKLSGVTKVFQSSELELLVRQATSDALTICAPHAVGEYLTAYGMYTNPFRAQVLSQPVFKGVKIKDIRRECARLRQQKQGVELEVIQRAIDITAIGFKKILSGVYTNEHAIERDLTVEFIKAGADGHAYEPIVASDKNATTLHYRKNNHSLRKNSTLLVDAGARFNGYCADITRSWQLGKKRSVNYDIVYEIVWLIHQYSLSLLQPGVILKDYEMEVRRFALKTLKDKAIKATDVNYPHATSHFLGIDVHDAGLYDEPLSEGSVLTVEPGVYLPEMGFGIRIEDNVAITKAGNDLLSKEIPYQ